MNSPDRSQESGDGLDRLLREAAAPTEEAKAPHGFADRVMAGVAGLPPAGAPEATPWLGPVGVAAILTLGLVGAVLVFQAMLGGEVREPSTRGTDLDATLEEFSPREERGRDELERAMRQGAGAGTAVAEEPARGVTAAPKLPRDRARLSTSVPGTLAGKFPRSGDGRFYLLVDRKLGEVGSLASSFAPAGAGAPALAGYAPFVLRVSLEEAERILGKLATADPAVVRPLLLGNLGLEAVQGVVTPPRADAARPEGATAATVPASLPGDAEVEIVVFARGN